MRLSIFGRSEQKSPLSNNWLKTGTFQPKFDKNHFLYQHLQPIHHVLQRSDWIFPVFFRGVNFECIDFLKNHSTKDLLISDIHVKRCAMRKSLLIMLLLQDIVDWVLFTLSTTCFIKTILSETLTIQNTRIVLFQLPGVVMQVNNFRRIGNWIKAFWVAVRCNICSLLSFIH